jgi:RNA polymerase sigma-70 factor (family 1)
MPGINQDEFDRIFSDWYYQLRNYVYYKCGDMQAAEDIVQDTFLKIWERKESIRTDTVKSLMYKIANNLFLNRLNHQKVLLKFTSDNSFNEYTASPDFELEMKEFDEKLQKSISELDEKNRIVFLMNRIDDLTYREIAQNLGLSQKAVEKRMGKAIAFLKEKLDVKI